MMTGLDSQTKSMIADTLARFVDDAYEPHARRMRINAASVDYRQYWSMLAELGILALPFTEALGGMSGSAVDVADAVTVLARGIMLEPFIETAVIAGAIVGNAAAQHGRDDELNALIGGKTISVMVGGRSGINDRLLAQKTVDGWHLNGQVRAVMSAAQADEWLVVADQSPAMEPIIFRLRRADIAAELQAYRLIDGHSAADVCFDNAAIPDAAVYLSGPVAQAALEQAGERAICAYCADAVGCMAQLVQQTGEYLRTRIQFSVAIGTFQALQHRFADMHMAYLEARAITRALAQSLDDEATDRRQWLRFAASSVIIAAGTKVGHEAIQMHGGMGVTDELVISHYNARLVTLARLLRNHVPSEVKLSPMENARTWI